MPADDLHPGVDPTTFQFTAPEVRAAIVAMSEMADALTAAKARGNHTGTQLASTISDLAAAVRLVTASETAAGVAERATTAEVQAMTDTSRYVSPAGLAAASVSAATANRIVRRDGNGRAQIAWPVTYADIVNKDYVDYTTVPRGTTEERNAFYGPYTTVAQQVAIANKYPRWFNTTTNRMETFYAQNGSTGLTAPGVHAAWFAAGWYPAPAMAVDWGGKSGIASYAAAYRIAWSRGIDGGGVINATADGQGIRIGASGIYEIDFRHRGGSAGNVDYSTLALDGNRENFEKLAGGLPAPNNVAISGVWGHDHPAVYDNFGESYWMGSLPAGSLITAGPNSTTSGMQTGNGAIHGYLTIKRLG